MKSIKNIILFFTLLIKMGANGQIPSNIPIMIVLK